MSFRRFIALLLLFILGSIAHAQTERDVINSYNRGNELKAVFKYDEADAEYQRCVGWALRVYGEEHKNTALLFHAMGDLYERQGKWDQAEKIYERGLKVREKINGVDSVEVAAELASLASVAIERNKPDAAEKLLTRALAIREKAANGEDNALVADTLNDMAILASRRGKPDEAEKLYRKSLIIRQKTDGPNSAVVAQSLSNLGLVLHDLERFQDAEDCHRRSLAIREKVKGPDDPITAESLNNLAILLRDLGRFPDAEELHRRALKIRETKLGMDHFRTASTVNNLAILNMDQGKYAEAAGLFRRALASYEKSYGAQHPTIADTLNNLGLLEKHRGRYAEAERFHRQALVIGEKVYGPNHEAVATKLNNLANLLSDRGKYGDAEVLYRRSLKIRETVFGQEHALVAASLNNLATLATDRGRPADARPLLEQAYRIREKVFGPDHPAVGEAANNLAIVLSKLGDRKAAELMFKRNLAIVEKALGENHPTYADGLFNLAGCHYDMARYEDAEKGYRDALPLFERFLGPKHPHVADAITNLGNCLKAQGKVDSAREHHERAREIMQKAFGAEHPAVFVSMNNLAVDSWLAGQPKEALAMFDEQRRAARRYMLRELPFLPETEQRSFIAETEADLLARALSLGREHAKDADAAKLSATWLANGKAVALEARTMRVRLDRDVTDPEARQALAEVIDLRAREAALGLQETGAAAANVRKQRTELWVRRRLLEQNIAGGSSAGLFLAWVEFDAISKSIPQDGLLVDIARFRRARVSKKADDPAWDSPRYVAWVTTPAGKVSVVDLGDAAAIDTAVQATRFAIATSADRSRELGEQKAEQLATDALRKLGDLVLKPLTPHLKDVKTLIISPDGDLWLAPWAALPYDGERYLVESITPRLVMSGRDLVRPSSAAKIETAAALVVADPDYNATPVASPVRLTGLEAIGRLADFEATFVFGEAGKLTVRVPEGDIIGRGTWNQTGDTVRMETERSIYEGKIVGTQLKGQRRIKDMNGVLDPFTIEVAESGTIQLVGGVLPKVRQLPLTRPEGETAAARLKAITGVEPRLLTDSLASEAAVKRATRPKALVLATHGFFLPSPKDGPKSNDPLARSGLMLAGCNQRANVGPGQEDGVLTGLEVVSLDLRGTSFVVLSACDTGIGETTSGDSVAGLRQAFQLAGADDVLATLWPIPDAETGRLMGRFYDRLQSGLTRAEVLAAAQREAIRELRKRNASAHPYYWAALTLTGRE